MTTRPAEPDDLRRGTAFGFLAYGIWGTFPLYFHALKPAGSMEILAHRVVWSLALCAAILLLRRDLAWIKPTLRNRRLALGLAAAAVLIGVNWGVYILAVITGRTYEAALGYFLNPIVTVALGVLVLGEGLRRLQWAAVGVGALAGIYLTIGAGVIPWIPLSLAVSFGLYGLVKKKVGASLTSMQSLSAETVVLGPFAAAALVVISLQGTSTFVGYGMGHTALMILSGVVTAIPLLLFAAATRRVPLVTIGLIQFITPVLQLLVSVLVLGEHVSSALWVGFGIVWVALLLLSIDSVRAARRRRGTPRDPGSDDADGTDGFMEPTEPV